MSHRYLILGLLMDSPMSGYDIKKHVTFALGAVTNASYGTLYPTLHKLLAERAVEMQEVAQIGRPSKKVYRITDKGRGELDAWLRQPASADQVRREFLLKLYLARNLSTKDLLTMVSTRRDETEAIFKALQAEKDETDSLRQEWVMDYALSICRAEIDWLKQLENRIVDQVGVVS